MRTFFAVTAPGMEQLAAAELSELGCQVGEPVRGGVPFEGSLRDAYRVNLWGRGLVRVRLQIGEVKARAFPELFKGAARLDWSAYLTAGRAIDVQATASRSRLNHTRRLAETVQEAIASKIDVQAGAGDEAQRVLVRMHNNVAAVSVDMSGDRLHRRGYREETGRAPLRESMAAALLRWAGWRGEEPLVDPMCGSGTFPIEAALIAAGRAPGLGRAFPFEAWPVLNQRHWQALVAEAQEAEQREAALPLLVGYDRDERAVAVARRNAERANCQAALRLERRPIAELAPPEGASPGLVICNPPYGERIGSMNALLEVHRDLGRALRAFQGWRVVVLTTQRPLYDAVRAELGRPRAQVLRFQHGGLKVFASMMQVGDEARPEEEA